MSRYTVNFTRAALKELNKLDGPLGQRILAAITLLEENPRADGVKKLAGDENTRREEREATVPDLREIVD